MEIFQCPYLRGPVELPDEREMHIRAGHSELLPNLRKYIAAALASPDLVQTRAGSDSILFCRWHYDLGMYTIVAVIVHPGRNWIITAYVSRRLPKGEVLWRR